MLSATLNSFLGVLGLYFMGTFCFFPFSTFFSSCLLIIPTCDPLLLRMIISMLSSMNLLCFIHPIVGQSSVRPFSFIFDLVL